MEGENPINSGRTFSWTYVLNTRPSRIDNLYNHRLTDNSKSLPSYRVPAYPLSFAPAPISIAASFERFHWLFLLWMFETSGLI